MTSLLRRVSRETLLVPVHAWRLLSRSIIPARCRYYPSCSQYCLDAVRQRGIVAGAVLSAWRVLRCNPWSLGGVDPVPASGLRPVIRGGTPRRDPDAPDSAS